VHYLVTGHTGFKGSWLVLLLRELGHEVSGLALDPHPGSLFDAASLSGMLRIDLRGDIRDYGTVQRAFAETAPDAVFHLAAQPLVRESYREPRWTIETNVLGTLNLLEAIRETPSVQAALMITSDKVYRNDGRLDGYVEDDSLGGVDPYSASKAMTDLLIQSWTQSFEVCPTAIARAGNVIGGGDTGRERLVPDLMAAFSADTPAAIRSPRAIRPWQHVLDCLHGYTLLMNNLLRGMSLGAWNFGPEARNSASVADVADELARLWGNGATWEAASQDALHEAAMLTLNSSRARQELHWRDLLTLEEALEWTIAWTKDVQAGQDPLAATLKQIAAYNGRVSDNYGS
jgi:CDP-glucose 4,6-dehydratase